MLVSAHDGGVNHHVLVVVIARQELENPLENAALGPSVEALIDDLRPIVLGIAVLAQRFAALAVERQAGGVDEYGGELGEQIAATVEQLLVDQVLDTAPRERPGGLLLDLLAEPTTSPGRRASACTPSTGPWSTSSAWSVSLAPEAMSEASAPEATSPT